MMSAPKVSVVIPFFNSEEFLEETIESVLAQTFTDWELLLVDDGSTDASEKMALRFAHAYPQKVFCVCHDGHKNRGLSASRNLGGRHARGPLLAYLDSDDIWLPRKLEQQVAILEAHPGADALFGETLRWFSWTQKPEDQSRDIVVAPWKSYGIDPGGIVEPPRLLKPLIWWGVCPSTCSLMLRREVMARLGGWVEEVNWRSLEDAAFYTKLFLGASIYIDSGCWEKYRKHEGSSWSTIQREGKAWADRIFFLNWAEKYLSGQGYHDSELELHLKNALQPYRDPHHPDRVELPMPVGQKHFGDLHRLSPVSKNWGLDRGQQWWQPGQPVDRYYIESFLQQHNADIKGRVLETGEPKYASQFGGERVVLAEVLDADPNNAAATYRYDLSVGGEGFPTGLFDCFILVQTLLSTYDVQAAVGNAYAALKPGGVLLATLPGIRQIRRPEMAVRGDFWRFTVASARRLFGDVFGDNHVTVQSYGNVLAASALLFGLASHELTKEELDSRDEDYQVIIAVRAVKQESTNRHSSTAAEGS